MKRIFLKISIILFLVMIGSIGVDALYRQEYHMPYSFPHNIFILPEIKDTYEIVKVGNSHADEGLTFEGYKARSLSLTQVAQSFEYDLANLKMYSNQIQKGAVIFINISPISFSQIKPGRDDSQQTQYYDGRLSPFLIPRLKVEDYIQSQILPFLRSGFLWRHQIQDQIDRRISAEEKWADPTPLPGASNSSQLVETVAKEDFLKVSTITDELSSPSASPENKLGDSKMFIVHKWLETDGFNTKYFDTNRKDLEELIRYCFKKGWKPVLITIPISSVLQEGLGPDYMKTYVYDNIEKTDRQGAPYIDFTSYEAITENPYLYRDSDHLNPAGASVFSYLLLKDLIEAGYLSATTDHYMY